MKKILLVCIFVLGVVSAAVCMPNWDEHVSIGGSDTSLTKMADKANVIYDIDLKNFRFTESDVRITVVPITLSEVARVEVTYSEELDDYGFYVDIKNETIEVGLDKNYQYTIDEFTMTIYAVFDEINISGGQIELYVDASGVSDLDIFVSGSAKGEVFSLDASNFDMTISGSGSFTLAGASDNTEIEISGSAVIYAENLVCNRAGVQISGSGEVALSVMEALDIGISGSGTVKYYGSPTVSQNTSGVSSIKQVSATIPIP